MIHQIIAFVNFYYPNYANDGDEWFTDICMRNITEKKKILSILNIKIMILK